MRGRMVRNNEVLGKRREGVGEAGEYIMLRREGMGEGRVGGKV